MTVFKDFFLGRTLVVSFWRQSLVLGGIGCGRMRMAKISGNKIKRGNIRGKVDLYEVFPYYILFVPLFILLLLNQHSFFFPYFGIPYTKGKGFRKYWPSAFESKDNRYSDEWLRGGLLVDGFNEACNIIAAIYIKVGYESMIAIIFWTALKGNLPYLSYIFPFSWSFRDRFHYCGVFCYCSLVLLGDTERKLRYE